MDRLKKPLFWLLVIFCIYAVFRSPDQAASIVRSAGVGLSDAVHAIGRFFDALLSA